MENKKALVIIPPYSEPLKKLGQILSTPEEAALIDIYVLEDLKEAGQLIPTLGQCLIVIANPKKCALFLQENRWAISKNHSKVILMTPKEIPQKTLMKFLKIGLTEFILETLPPKSLLYKIKLLLRSVKGQENKKEENINVKSMLDMNQVKNHDEQQRVEKGIIADDTSKEAGSEKEKKMVLEDDDESFDYLKAKKKNQQDENVIDTHWKSKRNDTQIDLEESDENQTKDKEVEEISTYYKNERNTNLDLDFVNNENMTGKGSKAEDESEFSIEKLKQSALMEIELEDDHRHKKKESFQEEEETDLYAFEKKAAAIELEDDEEEKKRQEEETIAKKKERGSTDETTLSLEKAEKEKSDENLNHIDAYYKGKVKNQVELLDSEEEDYTEKKEFQEESRNRDKELKKEDLDFEKERDYHEKRDQIDAKNDDNRKNESFEDESDTDAYMRGKLNTNIDLDLQDDSFMQKEKSMVSEEERKERGLEKMLSEEDERDFSKKANNTLEEAEESEEAPKLEAEEVDPTSALQRKLSKDFDLEFEKNDDSANNLDENNGNKRDQNKLQRLALNEEDQSGSERESIEKEDDADPRLKKLKNTQFELESGNRNNENNANVEHLDKYMRSRSSKSEDHDWDLGNKKKETSLLLEKNKAGQVDLNLLPQFKDAGEQTIDYRKLKEEFELLKEGANLPPEELEKLRKMIRGEIEDDDNSHRVYIPEPKGVDFLMDIAISLYDPSVKPKDLFEKIAKKIHAQKGYATFLQYSKPTDVKEAFTIFQLTEANLISDETRARFMEMKKGNEFFKSQTGYSLANWRCAEILDKNNKPWEDVELPSWAPNELHNKAVEYIYPMFDGLDRMGHIYIWFPEGINYSEAKFIDIILESTRPLYLDQIIRASKNSNHANNENTGESDTDQDAKKKAGILSGITSLFGKKKVG